MDWLLWWAAHGVAKVFVSRFSPWFTNTTLLSTVRDMFVVQTLPKYLIRCSQYIRHGYLFYALGEIPSGKDPAHVDAKLLDRYQVSRCRMTRTLRRRAGEGNVVYLRLRDRFILMGSKGEHHFFQDERPSDCRVRPILISGYSLGVKRGKPCIEIAPDRLAVIAKSAQAISLHNEAKVTAFFAGISPLKFQGVIRQQKQLLDAVNDRRRRAGLAVIGVGEIWKMRRGELGREGRSKTISSHR